MKAKIEMAEAGYRLTYGLNQLPDKFLNERDMQERPIQGASCRWIVTYIAESPSERQMILGGADMESTVYDTIITSNQIPFKYKGLVITSYNIEALSMTKFAVDVTYGNPNVDKDDIWQRQFSLSQGSQKWERSPIFSGYKDAKLKSANIYGAETLVYGGINSNLQGKIGNAGSGIQGVDFNIATGTLQFSALFSPNSHVAKHYQDYIKAMARYSNTVNDTEFEGFAEEELLFGSGSNINKEKDGSVTATLAFQYAQTRTLTIYLVNTITDHIPQIGQPTTTVDGEWTTITVPGWRFLWNWEREIKRQNDSYNVAFHSFVEPLYNRSSFQTFLQSFQQ